MTAPSRNALAAAADRAADSGFDALAKGPQETLVHRDVVA